MTEGKVLPASSNASRENRGWSVYSSSQAHQLVYQQCQDTEHQVAHDLDCALNAQRVAAELILEPGIAAFSDGAFVVPQGFPLVIANCIRRFEFLFLDRKTN